MTPDAPERDAVPETKTASQKSGGLERLASAVASVVRFSTDRARAVVMAALVLAAISVVYTIQAFDIRTDMDSLLSGELGWRKDADQLVASFPSEDEDFILVVDGATPELAEQAAAGLTERLTPQTNLFIGVQRLNGGAFFDQHGLLFLPLEDVRKATETLISAQPLLGPLAADPSMRGLAESLSFAVVNAPQQGEDSERIAKAVRAIATEMSNGLKGPPKPFSWRQLFSDEDLKPDDWRQFIRINPKLDYSNVMPGRPGSTAIHQAMKELNLDAAHGVQVRITGSVPIADEELGTLAESTGPIAIMMFALMVGILYAAVRSARMVVSMCFTVLAGVAMTCALGLLMLGRFNLISIAFLPLFVGLGMDFAVQYSVRARADRVHAPDLKSAQIAAALGIGGGLALAAAATAAGFLAFLPTSYRGVAELGLIAGVGMVIAFVLTITVLPAMICLLKVEKAAPEQGLRLLRGADEEVRKRRFPVVGSALALGAACALALPLLKFDFDPMTLRNPATEAMATYLELSRSVDTTPNTVAVLSKTREESEKLAHRLEKLPEVGEVLGAHSFLPENQDDKLALISDANLLLSFSLQPFDVAPPPSDSELVASLNATAIALRHKLEGRTDKIALAGLDFAQSIEGLASASASAREKVSAVLMQGFPTALAQINSLLSAEQLSVDTMPDSLKELWLSPDGYSRIEVSPSEPLTDLAKTTKFVAAVRTIAPSAAGDAVTIVESGRTILSAFATAAILSGAIILILLYVAFGKLSWTILTVAPVILSGLFTFGACAVFGIVINLENMIALPLLLGIGVAFNIYFVVAWRNGSKSLLASSLSRGVWFSALTTGASFGALALSAHPGTASMGLLLGLSLIWIVLTTLIISPALLHIFTPINEDDEAASEAF